MNKYINIKHNTICVGEDILILMCVIIWELRNGDFGQQSDQLVLHVIEMTAFTFNKCGVFSCGGGMTPFRDCCTQTVHADQLQFLWSPCCISMVPEVTWSYIFEDSALVEPPPDLGSLQM